MKLIKIKAFTLVELLVVMIISLVTLTTIYTVYLLVKKQYVRHLNKSELLNNYLLFNEAFSHDFYNADSIINASETRSIQCYQEEGVVNYEFTETMIIRQKDNSIDSFTLFPDIKDISVIGNSKLISKILLSIVPYKDTILLTFSKQYDAKDLIKER